MKEPRGRWLLTTLIVAVTAFVGTSEADAQVAANAASAPSTVEDTPREQYEAWVRASIDSWQARRVEIVLGPEWRSVSADRDLLEALRHTGLPLEAWEPHPRLAGRICARTLAKSECATVSYMTHDARRDLLDIHPSEIEGVMWVGPTVSDGTSVPRMAWDAQLSVERVILFAPGYLAGER